MSIILVGNGTSILDNKNGEKIDSFENVVRFNSFKTKGFEQYTGSKTNIWVTVSQYHINRINLFDKVIVHSWETQSKCKMYNELNNRRPCEKISFDFISTIPVKSPSTGLIAIHHFLKQYDLVTITGFDWWNRTEHHYADKEIRGTLHTPKLEYENIMSLVERDKVRFL